MSRLQAFVTRFVGAETAAAMEAESRAWMIRCPDCGFERSLWDTGGVRYMATGSRSLVLMSCPGCGRTGWHRIEKGANFPTKSGPVWPLIRLILAIMISILLFVALVLALVFTLTGLV
jgi:hypothetical protein